MSFSLGEFVDSRKFIKLNTNENPFGFSEKIDLKTLLDEETFFSFCRYPDSQCQLLKSAIADYHGIDPTWIEFGGGISELLQWFLRSFSHRSTHFAYVMPNYFLYENLLQQHSFRADAIDLFPLEESRFFARREVLPDQFSVDPRAIPSTTEFLILSSPNVPTGLTIGPEAFSRLLREFPGTVILDEAYAAFAGLNYLDWVRSHENLIIFRTFSKSYGLAGLRCAYMIARPKIIEHLLPFRLPYNVNSVAQLVAQKAIQDETHFRQSVDRICRGRENFQKFLDSIGWTFFRSSANFVFFRPQKNGRCGEDVSRALFDFLRAQKIILRHFPENWLANFLRCSIGQVEEMGQVERAILDWLSS